MNERSGSPYVSTPLEDAVAQTLSDSACEHCVRSAEAELGALAESDRLRQENERFRRQVHDLKLKQLRHERRRGQKRVPKRTALELADQLEFTHGLEVRDLGHGRWAAQCPAHPDTDPSLRIKECEDGALLVHCWGGCPTPAVLDAIGWEFGMLRPNA